MLDVSQASRDGLEHNVVLPEYLPQRFKVYTVAQHTDLGSMLHRPQHHAYQSKITPSCPMRELPGIWNYSVIWDQMTFCRGGVRQPLKGSG